MNIRTLKDLSEAHEVVWQRKRVVASLYDFG